MALIYVIFMINSNLKTSLGEVGPSSINVGAIGGGLEMLSRFKLALLNYKCFVGLKSIQTLILSQFEEFMTDI